MSAVRRRTTCEANKSGGRVLNEIRIEIGDDGSDVRLYRTKYEAVEKLTAGTTLEQV